MKRFLLPSCNYFSVRVESRKLLQCYMCCELVIWSILSYSAVYYGKIFDYHFTDPSEFTSRIDTNLYYELMFGHLNLTQLDVKEQRETQEKCDMLNTLFVFVFGTYWILTIFFIVGLSKALGSKCLLCPYVTYDVCVLLSVVVFVIYGFYKNIKMLGRNGDFFLLLKSFPSLLIHLYYRKHGDDNNNA